MRAAGVRGYAGVHPRDRAHLPRLDIQRLAELGRVAYDVRGAIGISPHAWGQAWITLGGDGALAAICARHATGGVKSPGGLLRKMVELHGKGTLRLDRTLFGLAEKMGFGRSDGRAARQAGLSPPAALGAPNRSV